MMLTFDAAIADAPRCRLDDMAKAVWQALAAGSINEHDAERLAVAVQARRAESAILQPKRKTPASEPLKPAQRQAAIERRRRQAASGAMPPSIAASFTLGEQAALAVIARAARQQRGGPLTWFIDKIAALAGVSRSTARNAIRKAKALGILHVMEQRVTWWRNAANRITIAAAAWIAWLGGWGQKPDRHDYKQEQKEAWRGNKGQAARPFPTDPGHMKPLRC
jgi:hypothetical protein